MLDFKTLELRRSPNQFLVCPPGYCPFAAAHLQAPEYDVGLDTLRGCLFAALAAEDRLTRSEGEETDDAFEFVQRSALIGFPDDISVRLIAMSPRRATLAIYSRSRYGWSDLGVNAQRVRRWLAAITDGVMRAQRAGS